MAEESALSLKHIIDVLKTLRDQQAAPFFNKKLDRKKVKFYDIEAQEFLTFAKQDLQEDSERGRVNALTNAKRAIECRIDECLALFNFKVFARQEGWKLPYKMQVLRTFGIPAPGVLRDLITSKRNLLEHEYIRPESQHEVQTTVEIAELFLKATDAFIDEGYISSVFITFPTGIEERKDENYISYLISFDMYSLWFNPQKEEVTLSYWKSKSEIKRNVRSRKLTSRLLDKDNEKRQETSIAIRDCAMDDIRELMILLREKGTD